MELRNYNFSSVDSEVYTQSSSRFFQIDCTRNRVSELFNSSYFDNLAKENLISKRHLYHSAQTKKIAQNNNHS